MNSGYSQNIQKQKTKTKNPFPPTTNNCRVPLTSALLDGIFMWNRRKELNLLIYFLFVCRD